MSTRYLLLANAIVVALAAMTSCGDDDPVVPRDREVTMSVTSLNHITDMTTGVTSMSSGKTTVVIAPDRTSASADITVAPAGAATTVSMGGITLTAEQDNAGRYAMKGDNQRITHFSGVLDINEQSILMNYRLDAKYQVMSTMPEIYFLNARSEMDYDDGTSYTHESGSMYQIDINASSGTATIHVMELFNKQEHRVYDSMIAGGATVTTNAGGYHVTAERLPATTIYFVNGKPIEDKDNYILRDINLNIDLIQGNLTGTFVLRHITSRDENSHQPLTWNDTSVKVLASYY